MGIKHKVTTTIDVDLIKIARLKHLSFQECLEFGIEFQLAEMGVGLHPKNSLTAKISKMALRLQEACERAEKAEKKGGGDAICL